MRNTLLDTVATSLAIITLVLLLPLRRFSRLPGTAVAVAVAARTTSRASIAAARASNMPGMGIAAAGTMAAVTMAAVDITAAADTMVAAIKATTIKATTIKAADRG